MSSQPNDDVRVNDNSIARMKTKKDQDAKKMNNISKKANMGMMKKTTSKDMKKTATRGRNVKVTNSVSKY